jgi:hypothetical protein
MAMDKFIPGFMTPSLQARAHPLVGRFSFLNGCYAAAFPAACKTRGRALLSPSDYIYIVLFLHMCKVLVALGGKS